jgi:hypothetical protein
MALGDTHNDLLEPRHSAVRGIAVRDMFNVAQEGWADLVQIFREHGQHLVVRDEDVIALQTSLDDFKIHNSSHIA